MIAMAAVAYDIHAPRSLAGFFGAWLLCGALFSALGVLLASIPSSRGALSAGLGLFFTMMMLQDPWLGLPWSLADTAVVVAFTLGAALGARLLFRWD